MEQYKTGVQDGHWGDCLLEGVMPSQAVAGAGFCASQFGEPEEKNREVVDLTKE